MKTIVIFDHLTGGHHHAFIRLFTKYLLKLNYRVLLLYQEANMVAEEFIISGVKSDTILPYNILITEKKTSRLGRFNEAYRSYQLWKSTKHAIAKASLTYEVKVDQVFIAWLDTFIANYLPYQLVDIVFPYQWAGLFFHPWYLFDSPGTRISISSRDSVLRSKRMLSVAIHDEFIEPTLSQRIGRKAVVFPEIADSTPPDEDFELAQEIKKRKVGRLAIGIIGLAKRKGVIGFIRLAQLADLNKYCFFMAGPIPKHDFSNEDKMLIDGFIRNLPENVYYHPDYIEEGAKINAVINALDILYVVYDNFKSSSNFNTKGVIFRKPVLATNRYWIGAVTKKYNLGVTVKEGNSERMLQGMKELKELVETGNFNPDFRSYMNIHNEKCLEAAFKELLYNDGLLRR